MTDCMQQQKRNKNRSIDPVSLTRTAYLSFFCSKLFPYCSVLFIEKAKKV